MKAGLKELIPPSLKRFEEAAAAAEAADTELERADALTDGLLLYAGTDNLSERAADEMAYAFHVDGPEGYGLARDAESRRALVKNSAELHRYKGTPYSMKRVLEILGIRGKISEWFEYGGAPYTFRVDAKIEENFGEKDAEVFESLLNEFKNARSRLTGITFRLETDMTARAAFAAAVTEDISIRPYAPCALVSKGSFAAASASSQHERTEIRPYGALLVPTGETYENPRR